VGGRDPFDRRAGLEEPPPIDRLVLGELFDAYAVEPDPGRIDYHRRLWQACGST
jgi:hypothetical protein